MTGVSHAVTLPLSRACLRRNPYILPILEPSYVVERVMEAVTTRRHLLCMPNYVYATLMARALPLPVFEALYEHLGIGHSMNSFTQTRKLHVQ